MSAEAPLRSRIFLANGAVMIVYLSWWAILNVVFVSLGEVGVRIAHYAVYLSWTVMLPSFLVSVRCMDGVLRWPYRLLIGGVVAVTMMMTSQFLLLTSIRHIHGLLGASL